MKKEDLLKFYDKFKLFIFPAVVALSSFILITLVIFPQSEKLFSNQKKAFEISQKGEILEEKANQLESYSTEDLSAKVNYVLRSYPADKDYINAIGILQNIVTQSGFNIISLTLGSAGLGNEDSQSYGFKLEVLGVTSQLPTLLSNIESSYRLMRVTSLESSAGRDTLLTSALNIEVLYSAIPAGFGNADSPLPELSDEEKGILSRLKSVDSAISKEQSASQSARGKPNPFE